MKAELEAIEAEVEAQEAITEQVEIFHAHNPAQGKHVRMSCTEAEWRERWEPAGWVRE